MALVINDRVKETTTTTGTGTLTLDGAVSGFETFSSAIGNTNTTYYAIVNSNGEFEVGLGTVGAGTLSRDTIISSSNSDAAVIFSAGTKNVFVTLPASKAVILDSSGNIVANNGSNLTNLNASNLASGTVDNARLDAELAAIGGLTSAADKGIQFTGSGTAGTFDLTTAGKALLDDADAAAQRTTLGLGSIAELNTVTLTTDTTGDYVASITAGEGITGAASGEGSTPTLAIDLNELTTSTADADGDFFAVVDSVGAQKKLTKANINISGFNNDSGFTTNTGTVTSVSGGDGLTGTVTTSGSLAVGAGTLIDVTADAVNVDLSELATSTSDADGDFFVVVDSANAQKKLTKGNINISGFNNDAGYTSNTGDITGVTAGTNLTGGGTAGTVTLNMATGGVGAGTYGSTADSTKIDTITVDAYGRVTAVATGATGDIEGVTAGSGLTGGGSSGTVTLNVGAGTGIDVAADTVAVDVSDFMSNGSNDRVVTATGTDAMNAESNLVFTGSRLGINEASPESALHAKSTDGLVMRLQATSLGFCLSYYKNTGVTADANTPRFGSFGQTLWQFNLNGSEVARIVSPASFSIGTTSSTRTINAEGSTGELGLNSTSSGFSRVAHIHNGTAIWTTGTRSGSDYYIYRESGSGKVDINSNLTISGSLSKGSGSFKIDHPLESKKDTHHLVHSFVEAPQADNIYRGKINLVNGTATVNIDTVAGMSEGTFVLLNTNIQCFTSNETGWTAVKGSVSENILTITAQDNTCTDTISWMVIGERQDQHMIDTEWTDENGKVIVEPLKEIKENN